MRTVSCTAAIVLGFALLSAAHPGHEHEEHQAALRRQHFRQSARRSLNSCADKLEKRGHTARAAARRAAIANKYGKRSELSIRDTETLLNTSHASSESYTANTAETTIFSSNTTCVLSPEGEIGPYFVKGEYIRQNLREGQEGVPIILDGQFVDVETCEPIQDLYWDIWNCNATGVYSGIVAQGNGNTNDESNLDATFLRGVQASDSDGVVQFLTTFPGHYSGRTTHIHMVAHIGATVLANNTLSGGTIAHVGQLFWDQDLIDAVEATSPYSSNDATITSNSEDGILAAETADTTSDPMLEYVMLGDDLSDGLLAWVTIAVNVSATYDPSYSVVYTSSGGVEESGGTTTANGGSGGPAGSGISESPGGNNISGAPSSGGVMNGTTTTGSNNTSSSTGSSILALFTSGIGAMPASGSFSSACITVACVLAYLYID